MDIIVDNLLPFGISFLVSIVFGPMLIWALKHLNVIQTIRKEGVNAHIKKQGTPTMGGLIIIASIIIASLFYIKKYPQIIIVLFVTIGFGIIGFFDDYIKVVMKNTKGLSPVQKLVAQFVIATVFLLYLKETQTGIDYYLPIIQTKLLLPEPLCIFVFYMAILGTVNGVNFTDGIDGLATSVTLLIVVFFTVVCIGIENKLSVVCSSAVGSLMGFLLFNTYPATVFMGDTGSLALGGFVVSIAFLLKMPLFLLIVGIIYLLEVLSVIIQITYYKITHGKRFFKMAPIHHHFELCGLEETKIVSLFSIVTAIVCIFALFLV